MHGYELIERLPEIAGSETHVDVGNLYRVLRALEEEGIVASEWSAELPGPAKRTYELTDSGRGLLDRWAEALRDAQGDLSGFLERYEQGEGRGTCIAAMDTGTAADRASAAAVCPIVRNGSAI